MSVYSALISFHKWTELLYAERLCSPHDDDFIPLEPIYQEYTLQLLFFLEGLPRLVLGSLGSPCRYGNNSIEQQLEIYYSSKESNRKEPINFVQHLSVKFSIHCRYIVIVEKG